jgi:hypothetical protein
VNKLFHSKDLAIPFTYRVRVHGHVTEEKLAALRRGIYLSAADAASIGVIRDKSSNQAPEEGRREKPRKLPAYDVNIEKQSNTITWLRITSISPASSHKNSTHSLAATRDIKLLELALSKLYLDTTRMILISVGSYNIYDLFPILKVKGAALSEAESMANASNVQGKGVDGLLYKEIKLSSELHAAFMKVQNLKSSFTVKSSRTTISHSPSNTKVESR